MSEIQFGLMIRGQFPEGDDLHQRFEEILVQARLAERAGFSCITKGSHYASAPLQDLQQIPFLARLADCWYIPPHNRLDTVGRQLEVYRRELDAVGKPFPVELPMRREVFVASTRAEALRLCGPALAHKYETYDRWGQSEALADGDSLHRDLEELIEGRFVIGSSDEVAEELIALCRATGVNHVVLSIHWPGMEIATANDAIARFAEEVMPRVRQGL